MIYTEILDDVSTVKFDLVDGSIMPFSGDRGEAMLAVCKAHPLLQQEFEAHAVETCFVDIVIGPTHRPVSLWKLRGIRDLGLSIGFYPSYYVRLYEAFDALCQNVKNIVESLSSSTKLHRAVIDLDGSDDDWFRPISSLATQSKDDGLPYDFHHKRDLPSLDARYYMLAKSEDDTPREKAVIEGISEILVDLPCAIEHTWTGLMNGTPRAYISKKHSRPGSRESEIHPLTSCRGRRLQRLKRFQRKKLKIL